MSEIDDRIRGDLIRRLDELTSANNKLVKENERLMKELESKDVLMQMCEFCGCKTPSVVSIDPGTCYERKLCFRCFNAYNHGLYERFQLIEWIEEHPCTFGVLAGITITGIMMVLIFLGMI